MNHFILFTFVLALPCLCSCATTPALNPSFPLTERSASKAIETIRISRPKLSRPVIVVGGFHDFGIPASSLAKRLRAIFDDDQIISVSFEGCHTFDACRNRLVEIVDKHFPSSQKRVTIPVDVVAISMGGLVSRYSAEPSSGQQLSIQRLFTISTPHRGSELANFPALEPIQRDMRPGSQFLQRLANSQHPYEIFAYVRLRDEFVRVESAAPIGSYPWWVPYTAFASPHNTSFKDSRFVADIAARLSGLNSFTHSPPSLVPVKTF